MIRGWADWEKISAPYVERFNLSSRMQMRRFAAYERLQQEAGEQT